MNIWFTSDLHIGHAKIIEYCDRPFATVKEMDDALISHWNRNVKPGDEVYFTGDFTFYNNPKKLLDQLNGSVYFIRGNHDKKSFNHPKIKFFGDRLETEIHGQMIVFDHYPLARWHWAHRCNSWMLYGHTHGEYPSQPQGNSCDIGIDAWGHMVSWDELWEAQKDNALMFETKRKWSL